MELYQLHFASTDGVSNYAYYFQEENVMEQANKLLDLHVRGAWKAIWQESAPNSRDWSFTCEGITYRCVVKMVEVRDEPEVELPARNPTVEDLLRTLAQVAGNKGYLRDLEKILLRVGHLSAHERETVHMLCRDLRSLKG